MSREHVTHFDDCGCLQDKHDVFIADLKREMAERLTIIEDLRKKNAALLEAAKSALYILKNDPAYMLTRKFLADAIAQAEGKS